MIDEPEEDASNFFEAAQKAIDYGGGVGGVSASSAFNAAAAHVAVLLADATDAFRRRSFGTSVFLSITAMEETAKAEILGFRMKPNPDASKRGRDPLRDHSVKHRIAVRPTTFMGRLPRILGPEACTRLQSEAGSGAFVELRERALYVHFDEHGVHAPASTIGPERAREILLLALECADDILVGWTNASYELGERFQAWIAELEATVPDRDT